MFSNKHHSKNTPIRPTRPAVGAGWRLKFVALLLAGVGWIALAMGQSTPTTPTGCAIDDVSRAVTCEVASDWEHIPAGFFASGAVHFRLLFITDGTEAQGGVGAFTERVIAPYHARVQTNIGAISTVEGTTIGDYSSQFRALLSTDEGGG